MEAVTVVTLVGCASLCLLVVTGAAFAELRAAVDAQLAAAGGRASSVT